MDAKVEQCKERIYSNFTPTSDEAWHDQVIKDLKGADYQKKLIWNTYDAISVKPYYRLGDLEKLEYLRDMAPGASPFVRGNKTDNNDWTIRQDIYTHEPNKAAEMAFNAVQNGVTALGFRTRYHEGKVRGVCISSQQDFDQMLSQVDPLKTALHFDFGPFSPVALAMLQNHLESRALAAHDISGSLDYDPFSDICRHGYRYGDCSALTQRVKSVCDLTQSMDRFHPITIRGSSFHEAGAAAVEELAFMMSVAVEYVHCLTDQGVSLENLLRSLQFKFAIGTNYFFEIAKFRAARLLWAAIGERFGVKNFAGMKLAAENGLYGKTLYDPYTNILRTTTEAMAATLGGVDELTVTPHDQLFAEPNDVSYRIARNIQLILKHESSFDKVIDPAAGSYYIETMTDQIAERSLSLFHEIEGQGGFFVAFERGVIKEKLTTTVTAKRKNIQMRRDTLLGTNQFPSASEKFTSQTNLALVSQLPAQKNAPEEVLGSVSSLAAYLKTGAQISSLISALEKSDNGTTNTLDYQRGASEFEAIRLHVEHFSIKHGRTPTVSLVSGGNLAMRIARGMFIANFFGCAGYKIHDNAPFVNHEEAARILKEQAPDIIVLCSSDDEYTQLLSDYRGVFHATRPAAITMIAGNPTAHLDELKRLGAEDFVHIGTNAIQFFTTYQQKLGLQL